MRLKKTDTIGVVYLLKRAELAVRSCAEAALTQHRLTPTQFLVLFLLKQTEGISSAQLARDIGVRPQSIVDLIRPLERAGLIRRREDPRHRRILRISLSPKGEKLLGKAVPLARRLEKQLLASFTPAQVEQLRGGLMRLLSCAQEFETRSVSKRQRART